ncbi:MAG: Na+/H+ antiporter [Candidatus Jettenia ecosi]|uniref:Na+/H+ antiporter n=1 Tax=Candidatus Jettenia ecosi TaxID=2494326 RepID=A0A533Q7X9_9BACT|nr:MAG: Na+/H+ antiporter [Candidatus Jettenia ecosi]
MPMHTVKSKQPFIILLISLHYFFGINLPQGRTEDAAAMKNSQQIPAYNEKDTKSLTEAKSFFPGKFLKILKEKNLQKRPSDEGYQPIIAEHDVRPPLFPQLLYTTSVGEQFRFQQERGTQTVVTDTRYLQTIPEKENPVTSPTKEGDDGIQKELFLNKDHQLITTEKEIDSSNTEEDISHTTMEQECPVTSDSEVQLPSLEGHETQILTPDKKSFPDITGNKFSSPSDTANDKSSQEGLPPKKDDQNIAIEKKIFPATSPSELLTPSFGKEMALVEEEKGTQTSMINNEQERNISDEKEIVSLEEEEKPPIDYQSNVTGKEISQDMKENSSFSTPSGLPATTVDKEEVLSAPNSGSTENSEVKPPESKNEQKIIPEKEQIIEITRDKEEVTSAWSIWHTNQTLSIILAVAITLISAKIGGWIANIVKLPEVVGNLIIGMVLGNIYFFTEWNFFDFLKTMPFLKVVSYFGTLLLLLTAGLHTDLKALLRVGASSFLVSMGGIIVPAGLGLVVGYFLLPGATFGANLILAIIICNTSTGLLFAILSELKAINTLEGRVITGATILTEIIVILTFGIVSGIAVRGEVSVLGVLVTVVIAFSFLAIVLISVLKYGESFGNFLTSKFAEGLKISIVVTLSLLFAFISGSIGLHGVIGAFAAGLLLRNVKFKDSDDKEYSNIERIIRPYYMILVPILFVRVGAQVDLKSFLDIHAILLGLAITGAAILGKLFCSVCPIEKGINRLAIGIGMAMKLEGTLILTGISRDIGILDEVVFSSIIMVIVLTSTVCPSFLRISLLRKKDIYWKSAHSIAERKGMEKVTID